MCILEAATKEMPWGEEGEDWVRKYKTRWTPKDDGVSHGDPNCPPGNVRDLVWRMCRQDPDQRASLLSVVGGLEWLLMKNDSVQGCQSDHETASAFDEYERGNLREVWLKMQRDMDTCGNDQFCRMFGELNNVHKILQRSTRPTKLLAKVYALLTEFYQLIRMTPAQARIMQLSSTRATTNSLYALHWRIGAILKILQGSGGALSDRDAQWQQQRKNQIELFVAGASDAFLLLKDLKSVEERSALLRALKLELENPQSEYTSDQLEVLTKAHRDISNSMEGDELSKLVPEWFIPWFELVVDDSTCLGTGGFGKVNRAKWLDSDVVVKEVILPDSVGVTSMSTLDLSHSLLSASDTVVSSSKRAEALTMFRREVDIWFGFSHPHLIKLFGACYVGRPFFVCEYATNGILVSYLRKYPDQLWSKLHEAALGVQYLHTRRVVHGDLKGNNIVIGSDLKAKVTDFGLSSFASNEAKPQVSAAWHWVAPECMRTSPATEEIEIVGPTFASDVYSLGMCIVEALRVVEAVTSGKDSTYCLPWCVREITAVKYHATHGKLPAHPVCEDNQWELIERMCALEPQKRIKISTVVDELARLATSQDNNSLADTSLTPSVKLESASEVIANAQLLLAQLKDDADRCDLEVVSLHASLWDHLKCLHQQVGVNQSERCRAEFYTLVAEADEATSKLQDMTVNLTSLTEKTMRYYALERRLDKFREAYFSYESVGACSLNIGSELGIQPQRGTKRRWSPWVLQPASAPTNIKHALHLHQHLLRILQIPCHLSTCLLLLFPP